MQNENPWYIETAELADMLFPEAGELWLASRTPYISPKTFHVALGNPLSCPSGELHNPRSGCVSGTSFASEGRSALVVVPYNPVPNMQ
jgi:hypothetical protein